MLKVRKYRVAKFNKFIYTKIVKYNKVRRQLKIILYLKNRDFSNLCTGVARSKVHYNWLRAAVSNSQPVNIRKNEDFKRNVGPICPFSQKHWIFTQNNFF